MSSSLLLDTSAIIPHLRSDAAVTEKLNAADFLYTPVVVVGELYHGAYRLAFPQRQLEKINMFLKTVIVLGISLVTADQFGQISARLKTLGNNIPTNDVWVAALAREHQLPLAARDDHFERVEGITLVEW
jgi:tRNA(fMet)-specific endonuclease VapC